MSIPRKTSEIKGAIYGTLLGDSWITNNEFGCEQISLQLIGYKVKLIKELLNYTCTIRYRQRKNGKIRGRYISQKPTFIVTKRDNIFDKMKKRLYFKDKGKQVSSHIMNRLTLEGVALWFMDDGYLDYKRTSHTRYLRICTDSFDDRSIQNIIKGFKNKWELDCFVDTRNRISFNARNSQKLVSLIYQYILPDFYYKIDLRYKEKTLLSNRCSNEYRFAIKCILQHTAAGSIYSCGRYSPFPVETEGT